MGFLGFFAGLAAWPSDVGAAAATLRLPEGTVKARLARARAMLKKRFPHLDEQPSNGPATLTRRKEA